MARIRLQNAASCSAGSSTIRVSAEKRDAAMHRAIGKCTEIGCGCSSRMRSAHLGGVLITLSAKRLSCSDYSVS